MRKKNHPVGGQANRVEGEMQEQTQGGIINYNLTLWVLSIIIFYMEIADVIDLRLRIADPHGYINIVEVVELPDNPAPQTAYRIADDTYLDGDGQPIELYLSDARLWAWIETYGLADSECVAYRAIAARLGGTMRVKRLTAGTETTEWQNIADLYNYYRKLSDDCSARKSKDEGTNTGRFGASLEPCIGGGDL